MNSLESGLINKLEKVELKKQVIKILHALQFDGVYNIKHCIKDLNNLLSIIDDMETPHYLILANSGIKLDDI